MLLLVVLALVQVVMVATLGWAIWPLGHFLGLSLPLSTHAFKTRVCP